MLATLTKLQRLIPWEGEPAGFSEDMALIMIDFTVHSPLQLLLSFVFFFLVLFPHLPYHHSLYISGLSNGSSTFSIWIICFYAYKYIPFSINQTQKKRCFLTPAMLSISVYDLHSFVLLIWFQNEPLSFHFIPVDLSYLSQWHCLAAESLSTHTQTHSWHFLFPLLVVHLCISVLFPLLYPSLILCLLASTLAWNSKFPSIKCEHWLWSLSL